MQKLSKFPQSDGTSQAERTQKALDPAYAPIDERSVQDLLVFAKKYASQLRYFNQHGAADGDWSGFLGEHDLEQMAAFLSRADDPQADALPPNPAFSRPHLLLFLIFLQLLQLARTQLNDLTRRHLEFHYRVALGLTSQKSTPDQVHALISLAEGQDQCLLPTGTLFRAGQDSKGKDLLYRSSSDLLANQAKVASIKSLYAEKAMIGIREAHESPDTLVELFPSNTDLTDEGMMSERTWMAMLVLALGSPGPGGQLPPYPGNRKVNVAFLAQLDSLLTFIPTQLFLPFATFRSLMQLKLVQEQSGAQWQQVNNIIDAAGKKRDAQFRSNLSQPDHFEKNLLAALGRSSFDKMFDGLPEVDDIYGLYRRREREDVIEFILQSLYMSLADFTTMMEIVEEINGRWRQIYEILRGAGRRMRQNPSYVFPPPMIRTYFAQKFDDLVQRTLGKVEYPAIPAIPLASFDDCKREIGHLEDYFHVSAEQFVFMRAVNQKQTPAPWDCEELYRILENAHADKVLNDRRNALREKHRSTGFESMILFALGDPHPGDPLPNGRIFSTLTVRNDKSYIEDMLFLDTANFTYINTIAVKNAASDSEWRNVYSILEQAQSKKRGFSMPRAEVEKWSNIYAASDASKVLVSQNLGGESATPRWRTFGGGYGQAQNATVPGNIGFAIASPLLTLAEGMRTITLTLCFRAERFDRASVQLAIQDQQAFRFLLSSENEMLALSDVSMKLLDVPFPSAGKTYPHALQVTLKLNQQAAPVVAYRSAEASLAADGPGGSLPEATQTAIQAPWPILQMMLADIAQASDSDNDTISAGPQKRYRAFQALVLENIHLRVDVSGLSALTLQNDESLLDAKKPFEPFGYAPVAGASFYIAHPELCSKKLTSLSLAIDWLAVPDDLRKHYLGYAGLNAQGEVLSPAEIVDNSSFKATLKLFDQRALFDIGSMSLFNVAAAKNTGAQQTMRFTLDASNIVKVHPGYSSIAYPNPQDGQAALEQEVLDWSRYLQLELQAPDFQDALYPGAAAIGASRIAADGRPAPYIVKPPYKPKIKRLTMGYSASLEIDLSQADLSSRPERLYHVEPFGYRDLLAHAIQNRPFFLPQYDNEGELLIGIGNLTAAQSVSLLFQMAEGSADPDVEREKVRWEFLDGNLWKTLEDGQLLSDSTNGLLNSGIIAYQLRPPQPSAKSTILDPNLVWIRAAISKNCRSVADVVAIRAQAVHAVFVDQDNAPEHFLQPLPAGSISELVDLKTAVQSVEQPYSSFGGKGAEQTSDFYLRVSERLRHKNRVLTCWDYEHLVLEAFPSVFKVKCLPVGTSPDPRLADVVQVIVIPDIKGKLPFDPFEPKLPADVLLQIDQYLRGHCPPWVQFKVMNPLYMRLKIRIGVRLLSDANPGYYENQLNQELQRYLSPWAYDSSAEIMFGGKINSSLIVNFVEKRPYVDYVAGIRLFISRDGRAYTPYSANDVGSTLPPDVILVSDHVHQIDLITEENYEEEYFTGIDYMEIQLDFQIA